MHAKIASAFDLQSLLSPQSSSLADGVALRRRLFFWPPMKAHKTGEGTQNRVCFNPAEVKHQMSKMQMMSRVLVDHEWTNIEEWVCALRDLADLDDEALDEIESLHSRQSTGTAG